MENDKIVVNQRQDEQYHESYWAWPKNEGPKREPKIPILVGHLKQLQEGQDCILVGWVWNIDFKNPYIKAIMENASLRDTAVQKLKQIINNHFRIVFLPEDNSFSRIRVFTLLLVSRITKTKLHDSMEQSWSKFAIVLSEFEKQYG
jgi:hypothetical protein